jgi:hypothetical protein
MAKNFSFTPEGIESLGIFPQAFYGPVVPKYESQFLLPVISDSIVYLVPNTDALPEEALALKLRSEGDFSYGDTDVVSNINKTIVQQSTDYILRILNDGGFYVPDQESAGIILNDLDVAYEKILEMEKNIMDRASVIGIDAAEKEYYLFEDSDFLDVVKNITETE